MRPLLTITILVYSILWMPVLESQEYKHWKNNRAIQNAIHEGLKFIAENQNWSEGMYYGSFPATKRRYKYRIAATSFAGLALMSGGNLPGRGKYGQNVDACLNFILRCAERNRDTGFITCPGDESRIHGHGFATLFLAQAYGMVVDKQQKQAIRKALKKAIWRIVETQTPEGGWGYLPRKGEFHEGSTTVCQLQALRACRNIGIYVPTSCIDDAVIYLQKSVDPKDGSFKYRLDSDSGRESFPLTAAGISSLNATGEYVGKEIKQGLTFMMRYLPPDGTEDKLYLSYYYYGHFYAAQAMYQAKVGYWERWFPAISKDLVNKQSRTGVWTSHFGSVYATSIAVLILQIPYNYLPIFQK